MACKEVPGLRKGTVIIQDDPDVLNWVNGVEHMSSGAGSFLKAIADAALRADQENYLILRPVLYVLVYKYPQYLEQEKARL